MIPQKITYEINPQKRYCFMTIEVSQSNQQSHG